MKRHALLAVVLLSFIPTWAQIGSASDNLFAVDFKANSVTLPMSYRNGANPVVEVMVNGQGPFKFMFDTGAAHELRLDAHFAKEWNLKVIDSVRVGDGSRKNDRWLPLVQVGSISLGGYNISNTRALVRNYNKPGVERIDGVIGLGYFRNVLVELAFERNQMIISKGRLDPKAPHTLPYQFDRGVPVISASLNGKDINMNFDTGNMGGLTFHGADLAPEIIDGEPKIVGQAQTVSNQFEIREAKLKKPLSIGDLVFEHPSVIINDVIPAANMGVTFSRQMNCTFDTSNKLLKLVKFIPQPSAVISNIRYQEFTGSYEGGRTISIAADGALYIKRLAGTALKMVATKTDEFGLEVVPKAVFRFVRNDTGEVIAVNVSANGGATWESVKKIN